MPTLASASWRPVNAMLAISKGDREADAGRRSPVAVASQLSVRFAPPSHLRVASQVALRMPSGLPTTYRRR